MDVIEKGWSAEIACLVHETCEQLSPDAQHHFSEVIASLEEYIEKLENSLLHESAKTTELASKLVHLNETSECTRNTEVILFAKEEQTTFYPVLDEG